MIKMKSFSILAFLAVFAVFVIGCAASDVTESDDPSGVVDSNPLDVTILHVNDTHSQMEQIPSNLEFDGIKTYVDMGGAARTATMISDVRGERGNTLLLHAGDAVQGSLYFSRFQGQAEMDFMNSLKFDAMVPGNHEFDRGPSLLAKLIRTARFPVISANTDASADTDLNGLITPYVIKEIDGAKVGIMGLTTTDTAANSSPGNSISFSDEIETAQFMVDELENQGINKIIALTHMGFEEDLALAAAVDGIDIVVGGHSHTLLGSQDTIGLSPAGNYPATAQNPSGETVYVVHSWEWAKTIGMLDVTFDANGRITSCEGNFVLTAGDNFRQKDIDGNKLEVDTAMRDRILDIIDSNPSVKAVKQDEDILAMLEPYQSILNEFRDEVIGTTAENLLHIRAPGTHISGVELPQGSQIAPYVCQSMLWKARSVSINADIALQNAGGVRTDIPAGNITVETVYNLLPFGNTIVVLDITGSELNQVLQAGFTKGSGAFPYIAGSHYTADATISEGSEVTGVEIENEQGQLTPIDDNATYRVVTNSYIADGQDGYTVLGEATGYRYDTGFIDAEVFMDYVQYLGTLSNPQDTGVTYITSTSADPAC